MAPPHLAPLLLGSLALVLFSRLPPAAAAASASECPLDLSGSNFTLVASLCSNKDDRAKCCRYINACVAVSVARYANATSNLGVTADIGEVCLHSISETLGLYGVSKNATAFCGFGTKIPVYYECVGRTNVMQMLQSPGFGDVVMNCRASLSAESDCRKCVNAGIVYLHHVVGMDDNITFSTCRDATFAALASQLDYISSVNIATCFFGVEGLSTLPVSNSSQPADSPKASPSPVVAASPNQLILGVPLNETHHSYHLTLVPGVGIAVTVVAVLMLVVLVFLIRRKNRELEDSEDRDMRSSKVFPPPHSVKKFQDGQSLMFRKFSYKETKKATDNFNTAIGQGGFGTVYKAQFSDGLVVAVKRMNKVSEQGEDDFCREIELLARLHHRHLVALRGFCIEKRERFLMYEYMANGSLKDHLHAPNRNPLSWRTRIQIAIDVANALEYLHFYCDPPLCHRDIKSSNILLDENFVAKVADFGLAHASKDGSICFEPVNTDVRGTPGYMDPEYVITQELTEKSDVYSYGVLLLEMVTARRAIQDGKNLVEWSQTYLTSTPRIPELVDPRIKDAFDFDQLQTILSIVQWCTQPEGRARPSVKQILRLLYETSDPVHSGFLQTDEEGEFGGCAGRGRASKGKMHKNDAVFNSSDVRYLASSSSTSRSHGSRSFLLESGSPQSPPNMLSL
ncbi:probable receptor-like protein kinase At1g49730 [Eucalyptus grandis]|uniref:probable receptor-like protein kinase At1g49730 n=1 Tax=Eucalyptus grandis TaxID=71139 RepID=UPI00192E7C6C|nr:probable receptor-like protein kinase At1g49730 [Eucalyptus grandis]